MKNNVKYYVFIARDEEELERYPQEGFQELNLDFAKTIRYKKIGGAYLLVISSDVKPEVTESDEGVKIMCQKVAAAIKSANQDCDYVKDTVYLFVHMGGEGVGGLKKWEEDLNRKIAEIQNNWMLFLLSSSWRRRIDVKQSIIRLPNRVEELDVLVKRCEMDIAAEILEGFKARYSTTEKKDCYDKICEKLSIVKIEGKGK